jgi:hypothetical protein
LGSCFISFYFFPSQKRFSDAINCFGVVMRSLLLPSLLHFFEMEDTEILALRLFTPLCARLGSHLSRSLVIPHVLRLFKKYLAGDQIKVLPITIFNLKALIV